MGIDTELASDYKICMVDRPAIPTAKQKVEHIEIPGRHGSLTKKGAFEDVPLKIKFNLLEEVNIKPLVRRIKSWFINGKTLYFTDDEVYRKIKSVEIGDIANEIEEHGEFEVEFKLDPFEYLNKNIILLKKPQTVFNPGTFEASPKLEIFGNGDVIIMINKQSFQMKNIQNSVIIDSDLLIAHTGPSQVKTIGEFPVLKVGDNLIEWLGAVSEISLEPRWRFI